MNSKPTCLVLLLLLGQGASLFAQPQPGTVLWTYDAQSQIEASPAVGPDGTIYFGGWDFLYAVTNMGSNRWTFPTSSSSSASPAVGPDGTVYYAAGFNLYSVSTNGTEKWHYDTGGAAGSAAIGADGCIYVNTLYHLQALDPSGTSRWRSMLDGSYGPLSPSLYANGTIFVASFAASALYSFRSDGSTNWTVNIGNRSGDSPAVGADGTVYVTADPRLRAFSSSGTNLWTSDTNDFQLCSPVIGPDGSIYVSSDRGSLCAFTPSGQFKWQTLTNGATPGVVPAVDFAGTICFPAYSVLYAINPAGVVQWSMGMLKNGGDIYGTSKTSPCIGPDGTLYVTSANRLYAIAATNKLADSSWPMCRQNARHTGRIEKPALQQPKKRSDGNFQFQLYSQLGQTNALEATSNLSTWTSLTDIVVTNVPMDVVDLTASNFISRFYRVLAP